MSISVSARAHKRYTDLYIESDNVIIHLPYLQPNKLEDELDKETQKYRERDCVVPMVNETSIVVNCEKLTIEEDDLAIQRNRGKIWFVEEYM